MLNTKFPSYVWYYLYKMALSSRQKKVSKARSFSLIVAKGINQEGYRTIFEAPDISAARHILNLTLEVLSVKASRAMGYPGDGFRLKQPFKPFSTLQKEASDHKGRDWAESGDKAERTRDSDISSLRIGFETGKSVFDGTR